MDIPFFVISSFYGSTNGVWRFEIACKNGIKANETPIEPSKNAQNGVLEPNKPNGNEKSLRIKKQL